jgi:hypothetical protein
MNDKKLNLESICKELDLDLDGDVIVAINNVNLKAPSAYVDVLHGVTNVIPQEHTNKEKGGE